ncbi:regulator of G-protein signaling loco isoform X3 [Cloeon dipterum]|uniref:regulator of G-protein signaling loco isoform X3 n=1 Tax=Cloeon dipterum TaxID=197152 RepID=UPI00321F754E
MHQVRRRKRRSSQGVITTPLLRNMRCVDVNRGAYGFGFTISGQKPCLLSCIVAGSPAEIAGLQPGHALMAVNGRNVDRLPHDTVVRLIGSSCGRLRLHVSPHWHEQSSSSDSDGETAVRNPVRLSPRSAAPPAELRAVVGYLGTIELPRHLTPGSRLAVIRSCVRRMRSERRVHTVVALSVRRRHSVVLSDASGGTIAEFGAERVAFCGACADDRRFFGLVTNSEVGSACHVFMIDPSLHPHLAHLQRAAAFRVACTPNGVGCAEFPSHADPILRAIASLTAAASPPPPPPRSNASSCPSSNSDSGIGFRDEDSLQDRLTVRAMPDPPVEQMRKLSPKVYGNVAHSLEDLPAASPALPSGDDESMTSIDHWGSLQDLARLDQGRQRRRRKHPTHHQHPMQPPSQPPQSQSPPPTLDDESDCEQPFKKWCSGGSYLGFLHRVTHDEEDDKPPPPKMLPPLTPLWGASGRYIVDNESHKESSEAKGALGAHGRNHSDVGEVDPSKPNCFDSFEKLLDDPNGMHAFSEFLKKEFSHENIYFWVACEKYRRLKDHAARKALAKNIFQKHLCSGAPEPVNVDSQARQATKDGLEEAKENLFVATQKQIFNLMKFDSYPRFLKSDSYKDSSEHFNLDPDLILHAKDEPNPGKVCIESIFASARAINFPMQLKKSQSDAEDRRRKSLLPWGRKNSGQSRSKSRDRGEEKGHDDSSSIRSELTSSRSSLASSDLALIQRNTSSRQSVSLGDVSQSGELCRVILPDGATTVISTVRGDTVKQLIARLLEKRGLQYSTFEIYASGQSNSVNLSDESSVLSGKEVRVEQRVVFRLDLPSKKTLGVRAKASKTLAEVLKPILNKHNLKLENAIVTLICDTTPLDVNKPITFVENERLQVCISGNSAGQAKGNKSTLDEITNRVFEELLQGKPTESAQGSDQGSVKSEDWSSDHGSGIFGRFLRRDSAFTDKTRESKSKKGAVPRFIDVHDNTLRVPGLRVNPKELYEGLKRAQRGRLEDQRGTDINFELPDFLKDKENSPRWLQKGRLSEGDCLPLMSTEGIDLSSGLLPTVEQAEAYFGSRMPPLSPPIRHPMDPPPLPPKPKTYPKHVSKWAPSTSSDDDRNSTTIV